MQQNIDYKSNTFVQNNSQKQNYWIVGYAILALVFLAIHFLFELKIFEIWDKYLPLLKKLSLSVFLIFVVLMIGKFIEKIISSKNTSEGSRYNLIRISRLLTTLFILILTVAFLFQNLYAAALSFGLISLIFGFALQAPIASFIGWIYLVFRTPYKVGDRIQIGKYKGDVIEISYLDTILLEFNGDYLMNDRLSGRVIHFPNSTVLRSEVLNYAGPDSPFIWNETAIQIAYHSDVDFVEQCLLDAAVEDFEKRHPEMKANVQKWPPSVYFRVSAYAWLEAVISYPVKPLETTPRRTAILKLVLQKLNALPDKAILPEGTNR